MKSNTTYWFAVEAFDNAPNYSDISNSPSATAAATTTTNLTLFLVAGGAIVVVAAIAIYLKRRKA